MRKKKLAVRIAERAEEFVATGSEIYHGNLSKAAKAEHY